MQRQPELQPVFEANRRNILAGAYRLNGRYLLDGGLPGPALKSYAKALLNGPIYTLKHWHRIGFACLRLMGIPDTVCWIARYQRGRQPQLAGERYRDWPGLHLEGDFRAGP
jgi:hypothetical protein